MYTRHYLLKALLKRDLYQPPELSAGGPRPALRGQPGARCLGRAGRHHCRHPGACTAPTDRLNPTENARGSPSRIAGAQLHLVDGGRHGFIDEYRDEAARAVLDFLAHHPL